MAGPAPNTKGWTAHENKHKPKGLHVIVTGMVEVSATNKEPALSEASHVGKALPLDLKITDHKYKEAVHGHKSEIVVWKQAFFHKVVSANEFDKVDIRWDGKTIASCPVIDDKEQVQNLAQEMRKANAASKNQPGPEASATLIAKRAAAKQAADKRAAAVKAERAVAPKYASPKSAAKKPAKKAAAKKVAKKPKAVGGWAKGKKAKKAKKAAKKSKGSALKKFVRKVVKKLTPARKKKRK